MAQKRISSTTFAWLAVAAMAMLAACVRHEGKEIVLESLTKQQRYYTVEAETEVVVHQRSSDKSLLALLGDREIVIPVVAHLKAGIDLSTIKEENVTYDDSTVHFVLPDPVIVMESAEIDWDNVDENVGLLRKGFSAAEIAEISAAGSAKIKKVVPRMNLVELSQNRAKMVLEAIARTAGYKADIVMPTYTDRETIGLVRNASERKTNGRQ